MCLLIGPPGVGKTLLMKRMQSILSYSTFENLHEIPATIPTVGTNMVSVLLSKKIDIVIRELGGCMGPIWHSYFRETEYLMYMIDLNNRQQISAACIQLLTLLQDKQLANTPVLLLLNKIDMATIMSRPEFENYIRLEEILQHCTQNITVHEISAWNGKGLEEILHWLQANYKPR
ncbi:ADP-ribosylation factor-like protein 16 [Argonauta hians]